MNASRLDVMNAWIKVSVEMERWRDTGDCFLSERCFFCPGSSVMQQFMFSSDIAGSQLFLCNIYSLFFIFLQISRNLAAIIAIRWWAGLVALVA